MLSDSLGYEIPPSQVFAETFLLGKAELDSSIIYIKNQRSLPEWVVTHMYSSQEITEYVLTRMRQDEGILPKE